MKDKKSKVKADEATNLLTCSDPKVLVTQHKIYLFFLHSRHDIENEFQIEGAAKDNKEDRHHGSPIRIGIGDP